MNVSPLPRRGGVHVDPRDDGRVLRVSSHPETGSVTISIWRDNTCVGTHQIAASDVPDVIKMLAQALVPGAAGARATAS